MDGPEIVTTGNAVGVGTPTTLTRLVNLENHSPEIAFTENDQVSGRRAWRIGSVSSGFRIHAMPDNFSESGVVAVMTLERSGNVFIAGSLSQASDAWLKKNVNTISQALDKVLDLRGVQYQWKNENMSKGTKLGFIAQELEQIFPELVGENSEGYKSVDYSSMTAVLTEAMKEQQTIIEQQEARITNLEERLAEIAQLLGEVHAR